MGILKNGALTFERSASLKEFVALDFYVFISYLLGCNAVLIWCQFSMKEYEEISSSKPNMLSAFWYANKRKDIADIQRTSWRLSYSKRFHIIEAYGVSEYPKRFYWLSKRNVRNTLYSLRKKRETNKSGKLKNSKQFIWLTWI